MGCVSECEYVCVCLSFCVYVYVMECLQVYVYSLVYFTVCEVDLSLCDIMWFSNENDIFGRRDRTKG